MGSCEGVAGDEGMLLVPSGDGAALSRIDRIELLADVGALIDRLRVSVAQQELRAVAPVTKGGFERVVVGVGDGDVGGIFAVVFALSNERSAVLSGAGPIDGLAGCGGIGVVFAEGTAPGDAEA